MTTSVSIAIGIILGLLAGVCINAKGIQERDDHIKELEQENIVKQNVADALNDTVNRLRRENDKLKKKLLNIKDY